MGYGDAGNKENRRFESWLPRFSMAVLVTAHRSP